MASEYGWTVEYVLDLPAVQVFRLADALTKRKYTQDILEAQLTEAALLRALAASFSKDTKLKPWPTWEEQKSRREIELSGPMAKLRERALS